MTYQLAESHYGKARIRLVTVRRDGHQHHLRDFTVEVSLDGDFEAAHVAGDNAKVVATDTMKNTVYALAHDNLVGPPEAFGLMVARHFGAFPQVTRATVTIRDHGWARIQTPAGAADDAFVRSGAGTRLATVSAGRPPSGDTASELDVSVAGGIEDLTVLKTTKSAFVGFERDAYTTLRDADDRIMATKVTATWGYDPVAVAGTSLDFDAAYDRAVERLLTTFAEHVSPSVQASIWIMAGAMLDADPSIDWVRMVLPNLHHWTVDLAPFGLDNRGEVFVATPEPHGLIDATVRRRS
jgi:urate oxidase